MRVKFHSDVACLTCLRIYILYRVADVSYDALQTAGQAAYTLLQGKTTNWVQARKGNGKMGENWMGIGASKFDEATSELVVNDIDKHLKWLKDLAELEAEMGVAWNGN